MLPIDPERIAKRRVYASGTKVARLEHVPKKLDDFLFSDIGYIRCLIDENMLQLFLILCVFSSWPGDSIRSKTRRAPSPRSRGYRACRERFIRARFEQRFTAQRMAKDYFEVYRNMIQSAQKRPRLVS
ncbi:hypothetical protein [Methylovirgula sp. HY1]|uniref:hypothetical protein n=1 Tax=Methylovirgula sp. HY1 TaxID=2822761 RepID=UPI001C5ADC02|nr:hypothetical protein [Methylovirgula sp. HY1]